MDWRDDARSFLENETQFHLGMLPTEQSHPATRGLSEVLGEDVSAGVRMLQAVDQDVANSADAIFASAEYARLVTVLRETLSGGGRVCFSGCGATGRLSILLEACWRRFWRDRAGAGKGGLANQVCSIMTGGDYALIRSVENFEDFVSFGRQQVREAGLGKGDVLVAITEGGETSSVIGTVWEAHERGAQTFFAFNNPADILAEHIERSRDVIRHEATTVLDLSSGSMAVAGSTRMQATTSELLIVGAALEEALQGLLANGDVRRSQQAGEDFRNLLADLGRDDAVGAMASWTDYERELYEAHGLVTYFADDLLLDIFTDTTERAPTFMLPPFRKCDDQVSPPSWAFVKNPLLPTAEAWTRVLGREPRCLDWDASMYAALGAYDNIRANPPRLNAGEIQKFIIGNEDDPSRYGTPRNAAILATIAGEETVALSQAYAASSTAFAEQANIQIGDVQSGSAGSGRTFHVPCRIPVTALGLWQRLAAKLAFNTVSTATMGCMGRLTSNWMACVETTNKKLIDRGSRLISELAGVDYETACYALFETNAQLKSSPPRPGQERPSPVALTIQRLQAVTRTH